MRAAEVHRDVYIDEEVFQLEMEHLFANTWVYVGHDSQVPNAGDYYGTTIGTQPMLMVRHTDGTVKVLYNRCPHKGTRITTETCGNAGKFFRCPYHAWSFQTDGSLLAIPLKKGYENTGLEQSHAGQGMSARQARAQLSRLRLRQDQRHRPRLRGVLRRQPVELRQHGRPLARPGKLEVAGGVLRYMHNCNWKMLVENQTDTCHPMVAHESSAGTAIEVWKNAPPGTKKPMAVEIYAPFMSPYEFFENMGIRVWPNGHGHTGVHHSIHSDYSAIPGYFEKMVAAYGEERAKAILDENRHNTVYFPNIMIKGPIQLIRLFKPLAPNKTLVEMLDLPPRRCARHAARAHADVQPADQRADLGGRPRRPRNVRARPGGPACRRQSMGQHAAPLRSRREAGYDRRHQRHHRMADAQPVPRLVEIHDDVDVTGRP